MKQILKEEEIVGKTIKSAKYGDNAFCLIFTDESFCIIQGSGYDENDVELSDDEIYLIPTDYNISNLLGMRLITPEEAEIAKQKIEDKKKKDKSKGAKKKRESEYQNYLKLKAKYEK